MFKFFYLFMIAALLIVGGYWFHDGQPTNEGYAWLAGAWLAILIGGYWWDRRKPNLNGRK